MIVGERRIPSREGSGHRGESRGGVVLAAGRLLEALLPRLGLRAGSYRKKRRTVEARLRRRLRELGLESHEDCLAHFEAHPEELLHLRRLLAITVSRFFRDREDWYRLARRAFPSLGARVLRETRRTGAPPRLRAASIGCACGEEPCTLAMAWREWGVPGVDLEVLALDLEAACLERGRRGVYPASSLRSMPPELRDRYLERIPGERELYRIEPAVRSAVSFRSHDYVRDPWPREQHLLLARYSAFFYLDGSAAGRALSEAENGLVDGGWLFVGANEERRPPAGSGWIREGRNLYRKAHTESLPGRRRSEPTGDSRRQGESPSLSPGRCS